MPQHKIYLSKSGQEQQAYIDLLRTNRKLGPQDLARLVIDYADKVDASRLGLTVEYNRDDDYDGQPYKTIVSITHQVTAQGNGMIYAVLQYANLTLAEKHGGGMGVVAVDTTFEMERYVRLALLCREYAISQEDTETEFARLGRFQDAAAKMANEMIGRGE